MSYVFFQICGDFYIARAEYIDLLAQLVKISVQRGGGTSYEVNQSLGVELFHILQGDCGGSSAAQAFHNLYGLVERDRAENRNLCIY